MPISRSLLVCAAMLATTACDDDPFETTAYFKDDVRNRVLVLRAMDAVTTDQVARYTETISHTPGHFTVAYIYEAGVPTPADIITLAPDYLEANEAMYRPGVPPWRWRFARPPGGQSWLVDCRSEPQEGACK